MPSRTARAGLLWPTILAGLALATLLTLGAWQWQRRAEKLALIERITARADGPALPLAAVRVAFTKTGGDIEYTRTTATGRFLHEKERYLYAPATAGGGWHVLTPMTLTDGSRLWINRGFVPDAFRDPGTRADGQVPGEIKATGLARLDQQVSMFTPPGDPVRNVWHRRAVADFDRSAFPGDAGPVVPFVLEADATPNPGGWPKGGVTRMQLPNRHFEYALTWWGLALTLLGVYAAFAWGRLRATGIPKRGD